MLYFNMPEIKNKNSRTKSADITLSTVFNFQHLIYCFILNVEGFMRNICLARKLHFFGFNC